MRRPCWYQSAQTLADVHHQPTYIVTRYFDDGDGQAQESVILFERELTSEDCLNIEHGFTPSVEVA